MPPGTAPALSCSQRLTLLRTVKISLLHWSLSILWLQTAFNLSLPHSSPLSACRQCPQPCCALQRNCSWAELQRDRSAHLPCNPSISGAQPSSEAGDQPNKTLSLPSLGFLLMSLGLQENLQWSRLKQSWVFFPSAGKDT